MQGSLFNTDIIFYRGPKNIDGFIASWILWRNLRLIDRFNINTKYKLPFNIKSVKSMINNNERCVFYPLGESTKLIQRHTYKDKRVLIIDIIMEGQLLNDIVMHSKNTFYIGCRYDSRTLFESIDPSVHYKFSCQTSKDKHCSPSILLWNLLEVHPVPRLLKLLAINNNNLIDEYPEEPVLQIIDALNKSKSFGNYEDFEKVSCLPIEKLITLQ